MKLVVKLLIVAGIITPISASVVTYSVINANNNIASMKNEINEEDDYFTMDNGTYFFKINKEDLHFEIKKGTQVWDSGKLSDLDIDENGGHITPPLREQLLTNPVVLYGYTSSAAEKAYPLLEMGFYDIFISGAMDKITVKVTIQEGRKANPELDLSFNINYRLGNEGLIISVTNINVKESSNLLSKMVLYPGFGMSYKLNDGYFLIPDGSGALIDLNKTNHASSPLQLMTYGKDIGVATSTRSYLSGETLALPMYGIADHNKAMMVTVENGQEYSELNAKVMGMSDDYNTAYFRYVFREATYQYTGMSESNKNSIPQENMNVFEPSTYYHLYDEPMTYIDLAKKYQSYLLDKGLLDSNKDSKSKLRLEFLMADNKKALFGKETVTMTTPTFIKNSVDELSNDVKDLSVTLKGYTTGGYTNSYPYSFPVSDTNGYRSLNKHFASKNIDVNYNVDLVRSFDNSSNKIAMNMSQKQIKTSDYVNGTNVEFYRLNPSETASLVKSYSKKVLGLDGSGLDFTSLGNELYSTYYHETNTRTDSINKYLTALEISEIKSNVRKPNLYALKYVDSFLDAPTSNSGYMIETDRIPFLSMVLSGYVSFYSSPINLNYLGQKQLLELIDYNISPSYLLTESDTMNLIDSPASSYIYSSIYDVWKDELINAYNIVNKVLKEVNGLTFVNREEVAPKVYKNTYEDGTYIIVNYSDSDYNSVKAFSSEVFKV